MTHTNRFSVLSWNIQGKKFFGTTRFSKILPRIADIKPSLICFQEFLHHDEQVSALTELGYHRHVIPHSEKRMFGDFIHINQNAIFSRHPIHRSGEVLFEDIKINSKINRIVEHTTWVDVQIGEPWVRIYSCHFRVRGLGIRSRIQQLKDVINHSRDFKGPVIICGDFNTTTVPEGWKRTLIRLFNRQPKNEMIINGEIFKGDERDVISSEAEKYGFVDALRKDISTWSPFRSNAFEMFHLKLDWFLHSNVHIRHATVGPYVSDHRYVLVECEV